MNLAIASGPDQTNLLERLTAAAKRGVSASELRAQRVSFIVSSVSDEKTEVTPEMVEEQLRKMNGNAE
ncbi:hypothetical protein HGG73_11985 [Rhodobacteraceae bacterium R_SAG3]|nr:hypothetical protein [Rhodobacteraceae bacterium R_SAG3]